MTSPTIPAQGKKSRAPGILRVHEGTVYPDPREGVTITDAAAGKITELLAQDGRHGLRLRLAVQPGDCAGLRYQLFLDDQLFDSDRVARFGDAQAGGFDE